MNAVPSVNASEQSASRRRETRLECVASLVASPVAVQLHYSYSMASRVQRLFSTLRALRHDNPLVSKCQFPPSCRL